MHTIVDNRGVAWGCDNACSTPTVLWCWCPKHVAPTLLCCWCQLTHGTDTAMLLVSACLFCMTSFELVLLAACANNLWSPTYFLLCDHRLLGSKPKNTCMYMIIYVKNITSINKYSTYYIWQISTNEKEDWSSCLDGNCCWECHFRNRVRLCWIGFLCFR